MILNDISGLSDSHFHIIEMLDKKISIDIEMANWSTNKGKYLIDISVDENNYSQRSIYSAKNNFIFHTIGIHPSNVGGSLDNRMSNIENIIKNNPIVGVGETGLDYYWKDKDKDLQKLFFRSHIELSIKYNLPLIIHNREASEDILLILSDYKDKLKGVIHCFSEDPKYINKFIDLGFYISFSGNITYKSSYDLQNYLNHIPLESILIETDSPYLSPIPKRGTQNTPNNIGYTFDYIANKINIDKSKFKIILNNNLLSVFNIKEEK